MSASSRPYLSVDSVVTSSRTTLPSTSSASASRACCAAIASVVILLLFSGQSIPRRRTARASVHVVTLLLGECERCVRPEDQEVQGTRGVKCSVPENLKISGEHCCISAATATNTTRISDRLRKVLVSNMTSTCQSVSIVHIYHQPIFYFWHKFLQLHCRCVL